MSLIVRWLNRLYYPRLNNSTTYDTLLSSGCTFSYRKLSTWWKHGGLEDKPRLACLLVVFSWCDSETFLVVFSMDSIAEGEHACLSLSAPLHCSFFTPDFRSIESSFSSSLEVETVGGLHLTVRTYLLLILTVRVGSRIVHTPLMHRMSVAILNSEVSYANMSAVWLGSLGLTYLTRIFCPFTPSLFVGVGNYLKCNLLF